MVARESAHDGMQRYHHLMDATGKFLYDGDCAFCQRCAQFLERRAHAEVKILPWQSENLSVLGIDKADCEYAVQWVAIGEPISAGPDAISQVLRHSPRWWWRAVGSVLSWRVVRPLAWPVYEFIARHRHRIPVGSGRCAVPPR